MSRYIDADALTARLKIMYEDDWNQNVCTSWANAYSYCEELVEEQPTADVVDRNECTKCVLYPFKQLRERLETNMVEVVRCKDCRYGHQYTNDSVHCSLGNDMYAYRPNDYCSYGERREDEQIH